MSFKHNIAPREVVGKNWKLTFGLKESTGGATEQGSSVNFTCASAVMWNINFIRLADGYSTYGHMGSTPVPEAERHELYGKLVDLFKDNTFMVQLVAVVNGGTAARLKHYLGTENKLNYHTADFVNYLINKKVGVVMESPVYVNTYHKFDPGPSICQAFMWFSPSIVEQGALLEHSGGIHGMENVKKFLHDSDINKTDTADFANLLTGAIVESSRFDKARAHWNKIMKDRGHLKEIKEVPMPKESIWKKKVS